MPIARRAYYNSRRLGISYPKLQRLASILVLVVWISQNNQAIRPFTYGEGSNIER